jgi:hypothetical protein
VGWWVKELQQIMAFNGVGMGFGSCSRVVFGVAIVLFLCNVSTSAPTVSASSEVTAWSEELQFARAEGNAQFLPSGICLASFLFLFKYVYSSIGYGRVMMCSRWCWEMVKIASCGV